LHHTTTLTLSSFWGAPPFRVRFLKRWVFHFALTVRVLLLRCSADAPVLSPSLNPHQTNGLQFILDNQYQYVIIGVLIGTRILSVFPRVMCARRAVPKIPAESSVPPRLLLHKNRSVKTPSESTLPQLLIPLNFNSRISNTYKNPQGEGPLSSPKVCQLVTKQTPRVSPPHYIVTSLPHSFSPFCVHAGIRATRIPSIAYSRFSAHPRVGGIPQSAQVFSARPQRPLRLFTRRSEGRVIFVPSWLSTFNCRLSTSRPICTAAGIQLK
jgi:hypothetical protein